MNSRRLVVVGGSQNGIFPADDSYEARFVSNLDQRQLTDEVRLGTAILPIGAIIGTAVTGSVILFLTLAFIIRYLLRSRHKRKNEPREALSDDNEEDIIEALRSTRPPEIDLGCGKIFRPTYSTKNLCFERRDTDLKLNELQLPRPNRMLPSYEFQVMGLRDSWPLVGWVPTSRQPLHVSGFPVNNSDNSYSQKLCFSFPQSTGNALAKSQRLFSRPFTITGGRDDRLTRSMHSASSSISSLRRLSGNRRSASDNQLTSILRSTSQRLKEAQRRPLSRAMSALNQVPGAPPASKPPSPPKDERRESRESPIEVDDASYAESVRSSVLFLKSNAPSPAKGSPPCTNSHRLRRGETSPGSTVPEPDVLRPSPTPDVFISEFLTSPSRHRARTDQGIQTHNLSTTQGPAKIFEDDWAINNGDVMVLERKSPKCVSLNDPFISHSVTTNGGLQSLPAKALNSENKQEIVVNKKPVFTPARSSVTPLSPINGNEQTRNIMKSPSGDTQVRKEANPFQWSPPATRSLVISPTSRLRGIERKGHRRQKTIRLSHLPRPISVSVVLEEPESEITPTGIPRTLGRLGTQLSSTGTVSTSSFALDNKEIYEMRPPSVAAFRPTLKISSSDITPESRRTSSSSYSATMSFYDYYASPEEARFSQTFEDESAPSSVPSPTPFMKRAHRRGHNLSFDISRNDDIARKSSSNPPSQRVSTSSYQTDDAISPPRSAPAETTSFAVSKFTSSSPGLVARLHGPRPQPVPAPSGSIAASVSMLRRMNSEVSTYSNASNHSRGSPTIPALRDGGLAPAKSQTSGTRKYLSIGLYTPSPYQRRSRLHDSVIAYRCRAYNHSPPAMDDKNSRDALGLVMPAIEISIPEKESLKSGMESSTGSLSNEKSSTTQLQPISSSLIADVKCQACNKPLPSLRFNSHIDGLACQYHDHCFVCVICKQPIEQAYNIDRALYCKKDYFQKLNNLTSRDVNDSNHTRKSKEQKISNRLSGSLDAMQSPLTQSIRHESQIQMPSPQGFLLQKRVNWRTSLGLYDEMGFLRSSPDRSPEVSPKAK